MSKKNRIKISLRQKTILIIFGLLLTLTILEIGLRLGGFIILLSQERRNLLSIRQKGEYRIICFGESTTQGQYPSYLEAILNQRNIGIKFSVIDKGIAGTNTGFIVSQLEANLDEYHPDLVVTMMGINDHESKIAYEVGSTTQIILFFKSFRIYKLTRLLWLHIITKAKEMGFYKLQKNNWFERNLQEIGLKAVYTNTKEGNLIQRETTFKKALELNPQNDWAYIELGRLYAEQGELNEAERVFKKALELNPQNDRAYIELGQIYAEQGKLNEAEQVFKKALELNPQNDRAYSGLGWLYAEQGKLNEAEQVFKKVLELNPQNDRAYSGLAVVYGERGNYILYKDYERRAERIRKRLYNPVSINSYLRFKKILNRRKIEWICVQYPVRGIEPLKKIFEGEKGIFFVDNEKIFKDAVLREGYSEYFKDIFGGDFGHCTEKGNTLLSDNIAKVILKEVFDK